VRADRVSSLHAHSILERAPQRARLLAGEPHQVGVDDDGAKAVVAAVPGDHRLSRGGINDRIRSGYLIDERLP
jgi:hypothetical protein